MRQLPLPLKRQLAPEPAEPPMSREEQRAAARSALAAVVDCAAKHAAREAVDPDPEEWPESASDDEELP